MTRSKTIRDLNGHDKEKEESKRVVRSKDPRYCKGLLKIISGRNSLKEGVLSYGTVILVSQY